jgi:U-box domain
MAASIPDEFVCPISGDVMRDPVWLSTGIAVDRTYAEYYLQAGFRQCPVTGETIADTKLVPVRSPACQHTVPCSGRRARCAVLVLHATLIAVKPFGLVNGLCRCPTCSCTSRSGAAAWAST